MTLSLQSRKSWLTVFFLSELADSGIWGIGSHYLKVKSSNSHSLRWAKGDSPERSSTYSSDQSWFKTLLRIKDNQLNLRNSGRIFSWVGEWNLCKPFVIISYAVKHFQSEKHLQYDLSITNIFSSSAMLQWPLEACFAHDRKNCKKDDFS